VNNLPGRFALETGNWILKTAHPLQYAEVIGVSMKAINAAGIDLWDATKKRRFSAVPVNDKKTFVLI
jgi:hypothetical protein